MATISMVSRPYRCEINIKMSRFIADVFPVISVSEAQEYVSGIRKEFSDANHVVFAYVVGVSGQAQKYSDDGEPAGTAGAPVLDVIKKNGITNTLLVVTRYFGGIKLGTGGLVRAYTQAARTVLDKAGLTAISPHLMMNITMNYKALDFMRIMIEGVNGYIETTDFTEKISMTAFIPETSVEKFLHKTVGLPGIEILTGETKVLPKKNSP